MAVWSEWWPGVILSAWRAPRGFIALLESARAYGGDSAVFDFQAASEDLVIDGIGR